MLTPYRIIVWLAKPNVGTVLLTKLPDLFEFPPCATESCFHSRVPHFSLLLCLLTLLSALVFHGLVVISQPFLGLHDRDTLKWSGILYTSQVFCWTSLSLRLSKSFSQWGWGSAFLAGILSAKVLKKRSIDFGEVRHRNDGWIFFCIKTLKMKYPSYSHYMWIQLHVFFFFLKNKNQKTRALPFRLSQLPGMVFSLIQPSNSNHSLRPQSTICLFRKPCPDHISLKCLLHSLVLKKKKFSCEM